MQLIDSIQTYYVHNISASHINLQRFGVSVIYKYVVAHLGSSHLKVQKIVASWFDFCVWTVEYIKTKRKIKYFKNFKLLGLWMQSCYSGGVSSHSQRRKKGCVAECSGSRVEEGVDSGQPCGSLAL